MVFTSLKRKLGREVSFKSKKRRRITVNQNFNSSEINNLNTSNSNDVIVNSNLPRISVHTNNSLNKLITLQNIKSSISINGEMMDGRNISEEISCQHDNIMD